MEFLILSSSITDQRRREQIIMQAVIEAAERLGIRRIIKRRCNVLSTGVYVVERNEKRLVYNDWEKEWDPNRILEKIISSVSPLNEHRSAEEIILTLS
jgi:hypothetical protein